MRKHILLITVVIGVSIFVISLENPAEETKVYKVGEAVEGISQHKGQNITVKGTVMQGRLACTDQACIKDECCNTCSGPVKLQGNTSIRITGDKVGCSGTNCKVNCTPETGEEYIFEGLIQEKYGEISLKAYNYRRVEN